MFSAMVLRAGEAAWFERGRPRHPISAGKRRGLPAEILMLFSSCFNALKPVLKPTKVYIGRNIFHRKSQFPGRKALHTCITPPIEFSGYGHEM